MILRNLLLSVALMLEHAFGKPRMARAVESAVVAALRATPTPEA